MSEEKSEDLPTAEEREKPNEEQAEVKQDQLDILAVEFPDRDKRREEGHTEREQASKAETRDVESQEKKESKQPDLESAEKENQVSAPASGDVTSSDAMVTAIPAPLIPEQLEAEADAPCLSVATAEALEKAKATAEKLKGQGEEGEVSEDLDALSEEQQGEEVCPEADPLPDDMPEMASHLDEVPESTDIVADGPALTEEAEVETVEQQTGFQQVVREAHEDTCSKFKAGIRHIKGAERDQESDPTLHGIANAARKIIEQQDDFSTTLFGGRVFAEDGNEFETCGELSSLKHDVGHAREAALANNRILSHYRQTNTGWMAWSRIHLFPVGALALLVALLMVVVPSSSEVRSQLESLKNSQPKVAPATLPAEAPANVAELQSQITSLNSQNQELSKSLEASKSKLERALANTKLSLKEQKDKMIREKLKAIDQAREEAVIEFKSHYTHMGYVSESEVSKALQNKQANFKLKRPGGNRVEVLFFKKNKK